MAEQDVTSATARERDDDRSANGVNGGRTADGRFAPGNSGGPGAPHARRVARLRSLLLEAISDQDLQAIACKLVDMAKGGDLPAVKELLDRVIGRAVSSDLLERVEAIEAQLNGLTGKNASPPWGGK